MVTNANAFLLPENILLNAFPFQATIQIRNEDPLESNLITTHEPTLRPHTELFRVGAVYTLEERRIDNSKLT